MKMKHEEMVKLILQLRNETWYEFKEYCQKALIEFYSKWLNQQWKYYCEWWEIDYDVYSEYDLTKTKSFENVVDDIKIYVLNTQNYPYHMNIKDLNSRIEDLEEFLKENGEDKIQSFKDDYKKVFFEELKRKYLLYFSEPDYWYDSFNDSLKEATGMTRLEFLKKNNKL
jgi:hypothetical protein